jgi:hypothetical protein
LATLIGSGPGGDRANAGTSWRTFVPAYPREERSTHSCPTETFSVCEVFICLSGRCLRGLLTRISYAHFRDAEYGVLPSHPQICSGYILMTGEAVLSRPQLWMGIRAPLMMRFVDVEFDIAVVSILLFPFLSFHTLSQPFFAYFCTVTLSSCLPHHSF